MAIGPLMPGFLRLGKPNGLAAYLAPGTRWNSIGERAAHSRLASLFLLLAFFWIIAAAGFSGYIGKWSLRENEQRYGIEAMLKGTAHRPFVYRQLVPMLASAADTGLPDGLKEHIVRGTAYAKFSVPLFRTADPQLLFRYVVVYYITFLAFLASLFVLREIVLDSGASVLTAILAPSILVLAFPYIQTVGGYFYDGVELLFMSLTFLAASRGKLLVFFALIVPATLNKETFFFFLPALYPIFKHHASTRKTLLIVCAAIFVSGLVNLSVKLAFAAAPGAPAEVHLFENVRYYLMPWTYRLTETTYGVVGPAGLSIATIAVILIIIARGWAACPARVRQHLLIAAAINLPLFLSFAAGGELRNLSLLFVGLVILLARVLNGASWAAMAPRS